MKKKLQREFVCKLCGMVFYSYSANAKYCMDCRYENKKKEKRNYMNNKRHPELLMNKYRNKSLDETLLDIKKYNKKHGTKYSYGEYIGRRDCGWL